QRAYLGILGPGIVLGAMLFAGLARVIGRRASVPLASALFVGYVLLNVSGAPPWESEHEWHVGAAPMLEGLRGWGCARGSRVYATPGDHLTLQWYTGMPVQSIAPIRREFLTNYPGDILFIESIPRLKPLTPEVVRDRAARAGIALSDEDVLRD